MPAAFGVAGRPLDQSPPVVVSFAYGPTPIDVAFFVAQRAYRVNKISGRPLVAAAGATAEVRKAASGTAVASGTLLHSGTITLDGAANTNQALTLSAVTADLNLAAGDALGLDVSGTTTNATGVVTVELLPLA